MRMALPVPPAPTTNTRMGRRPRKPGGSECSMRISIPFFADELHQGLGKEDQGLQREQTPLACQAAPKTLESTFVARNATDVGKGKGTLVEAPFPGGNGRDGCVLWPPHRSCADGADVREIPVGRDSELRFCLGTFVPSESADFQLSVSNPPHQRRLRKNATVQIRRLSLGVLIKHLTALCRCPPGNHAITFGEDVLWKHFGSSSAPERANERLHECYGERLRWSESRCCVLLGGNLVLRNEGCLVPVVNQQRLTQLEAMVLPDCYLNLHFPSPIPVVPQPVQRVLC